MLASEIEQFLLATQWPKTVVLPRYTPPNWWECDVAEVTKADLLVEYEIKVSRADFKIDRLKSRVVYRTGIKELKHHLLRDRHTSGPSRFWYVTPVGLLNPTEIPKWAGLLEVSRSPEGRYCSSVIVRAPLLHKTKMTQDKMFSLFRNCYFRYHQQRERCRKLNSKLQTPSTNLRGLLKQ